MGTSLRIVHTSDIHLGSGSIGEDKSCQTLQAVLNAAQRVQAGLTIIAGDLFDSPRVPDGLVKLVSAALEQFASPVLILPGNHDCLVPDSPYFRAEFTRFPHVHVIQDPEGELVRYPALNMAVWGRPHVDYSDFGPLQRVPARGTEKWQLAVAHGLYDAGHPSQAGRGWRITDEDISRSARDYLALGHLELYNRVGTNGVAAYYSGSPRQTSAVALIELQDSHPIVTQVPL